MYTQSQIIHQSKWTNSSKDILYDMFYMYGGYWHTWSIVTHVYKSETISENNV